MSKSLAEAKTPDHVGKTLRELRRSRRIIRAGEDLLKLVGDHKSDDARSGTLED